MGGGLLCLGWCSIRVWGALSVPGLEKAQAAACQAIFHSLPVMRGLSVCRMGR